MDVQLYVYDLSGGMARQYSMALAGVQIDAIYHTAIVFGGVEYFFGQGVHRKVPGSTHHGQPMKIIELGQTQLPVEVIQEYIQSLEAIYTPESYDLFVHNCNNFSQDLAMFLVGKDIPHEIRTLPETFLRTPIGQMLRGQIDQSMRQMTQAPDAMAGRNVIPTQARATMNGALNGNAKSVYTNAGALQPVRFSNGGQQAFIPGHVYNVTSSTELDKLLRSAESNCACIFFTSATCPPCKIVYPAYDEIASEAGSRATLIKVDTNNGFDIARRYQIRATPTFITFLKGKKEEEWSGANEAQLRGNIRLLIQMANPQHAHTSLRVPNLHSKVPKPIVYTRVPPLDKLLSKIGPSANDRSVQDLIAYIRARESKGLENAPIPDLHSLSEWMTSTYNTIPSESHFAVVDLFRVAAVDPRISSFLTTEPSNKTLLKIVPVEKDFATVPYNLQATTLQLVNNLFSSTIFQESIQNPISSLRAIVERLGSTCLLATHQNARSLAAALVYNVAAYDHNERIDNKSDKIDLSLMADLEAALVEAVVNETENKETLHALLLALGLLLYRTPNQSSSSIWDLCAAMDVRASLKEKGKMSIFKDEELIREVGEELLAKGGT